MARFGTLGTQYFDDNGDPLVDGKIYFYESGTTTEKTTYADVNLTIANPNPVILSGSGRQPNIFFNGTASAILTDKDDVQIEPRDPVGETGSNYGDEWIPTKTYSSGDVVRGSDGAYYQSALDGNIGIDPISQPNSSWFLTNTLAWQQARTYVINETVSGSDGDLYKSLVNDNLGNDPTTSPTEWDNTSAGSAKLDGANFTGGVGEAHNSITSTANALTADCSTGNNFTHVLTENTTLSFTNVPATGTAFGVTMKIVQDAGASGFTFTWPASVDWAEATAPTLTATASAVDIFVLYTYDGGTTWYGFTSGQAMA